MTDLVLRLQGLKCPLPVLRTRKALQAIKPGSVIVVECTDELAAIDIPNLVRETGDSLEQSEQTGKTLIFRIRKGCVHGA